MRTLKHTLFSAGVGVALLASACNPIGGLLSMGKETRVSIVYGSEKQAWLEPLVETFNQARHKTESGSTIQVEITPMGSIESVEAILEGSIQPVVWSPASSIYIPVANAEWRKAHNEDLVSAEAKDLVLSPVVIAMWQPMAEALGWPEKKLGWEDIAALSTSGEGWAAYGYPEWGAFKFGHTHPEYSNSGLVSILAQAYAGAGKQRGLSLDDLQDPHVREFMTEVQGSIIHYGTSTGFFATRMFERGPSYLSAAVLYENLVVTQETQRLKGASQQVPVAAIYPKEGTFWANHPYAILNAPWVSDEQREAAEVFESFLLERPQQLSSMDYGFRPADPAIALAAPLDAAHGVDPSQPQTILEIPSENVIRGAQEFWKTVKKPVDLVTVVDTSGSMAGDKIAAVRTSLGQFVNMLDDRDRLGVTLFSSELTMLTPLSELGAKRDQTTRRVGGLIEGGDTRLYDGILAAYTTLQKEGDAGHIRALVVLSDGQDTASEQSLNDLLEQISSGSEEGGNAIKVFTIAYGEDADQDVLKRIAEATGARLYESTPENIQQIYQEIATFF